MIELGIVSKHFNSGALNSGFSSFDMDPGGRFSTGSKFPQGVLVVGSQNLALTGRSSAF